MSIFNESKTLGVLLKKFRIDEELSARKLAEKLDMSTTFLSRIENDQCNTISEKMRGRLLNLFKTHQFTEKDLFKLQCLIDIANGKVSLKGLPVEQKKLAVRLASKDLTQSQIEKINKILGSL